MADQNTPIMSAPDEDTNEYKVLVNAEGQYSLWLAWRDVPLGWGVVGPRGSKQECVAYVEANWTDMTPISLRRPKAEESRQ